MRQDPELRAVPCSHLERRKEFHREEFSKRCGEGTANEGGRIQENGMTWNPEEESVSRKKEWY